MNDGFGDGFFAGVLFGLGNGATLKELGQDKAETADETDIKKIAAGGSRMIWTAAGAILRGHERTFYQKAVAEAAKRRLVTGGARVERHVPMPVALGHDGKYVAILV